MATKETPTIRFNNDDLEWWKGDNPQEQHNLSNTLKHIFSGVSKSGIVAEKNLDLKDLWYKYHYGDGLTDEDKKDVENQFVQKYKEIEELNNQIYNDKQYLDSDDSALAYTGSHSLSAGTTLTGLAKQWGLRAAGAPFGLSEVGNLAGSAWSTYDDVAGAATETLLEAMEKTGRPDLADQAYRQSLQENAVYALPGFALQTALGSKAARGAVGGLIGKAIPQSVKNSKLVQGITKFENSAANKFAQAMERSKISQAARKLGNLDIGDEAVGKYFAKKISPLAGKVARGTTQAGLEFLEEEGQEGQQGYSTNRAIARALHQVDPVANPDTGEWSIESLRDYLNTKEARETALDTGISTLVTSVPLAMLGGFNKLGHGYNHKTIIRNAPEIVKNLNIDPETFSMMKNSIGARHHLSEQQTANLSPEEVAMMWAEDYAERKQLGNVNEEVAAGQGLNDFINRATNFVGREDYMSEDSENILSNLGVNTDGLITKADRLKAEQEALANQPTQAKESHDNVITDDTTPFSQKVSETGTTNTKEQVQAEQAQTPNGLAGILQQKEQDFGGHWHVQQVATIGENEYDEGTAILTNDLTNKTIRITDIGNGQLSVIDETPEGTTSQDGSNVDSGKGAYGLLNQTGRKTRFSTDEKGLKALSSFLKANEKQTKTLKQEGDQGQQQEVVDPNRRRVLINGANDLANFYRQNPDLMNEDQFMGIIRAMMTYGKKGVAFDFDLEREKVGEDGGRVYAEYNTVDDGVHEAVISLYSGSDVASAIHEFAHVGYDTMSEHEQQLFNQMAISTQESFVATVLRNVNPQLQELSDEEVIQLIRNSIQMKDGEIWKQIKSLGILRQTLNLINGETNPDRIQEACEERYAHEFTAWYMEGYTKGMQPTNRMQNLLNRTCRSLQQPLAIISAVAEHLQSQGWQAVSNKSRISMYEDMNTRANNVRNEQGSNVQEAYTPSTGQVQQEQTQQEDDLQQNLFSPQFMYPEQTGEPTYVQGELFQNNSGNTPNVVTTRGNEQRRENAAVQQNQRMQPVYLARLNKLVNQDESVTRDELEMVLSLDDKSYRQYANKVLAKQYPSQERLDLLSNIDQQRGNKFADRIQKKMQVLQGKEARKSAKELERQNNKDLMNILSPKTKEGKRQAASRLMKEPVTTGLRNRIEQKTKDILSQLIENQKKGENNLKGYIMSKATEFDVEPAYKDAMRRFKAKNKREAQKYDGYVQEALQTAARNSTWEVDRTEDGDTVYGTVNPQGVVDTLNQQLEGYRQDEQQQYLTENEDKVQENYNKLMDKYKSGGEQAVRKVLGAPAVKKSPIWQEAARRFEQYLSEQKQETPTEETKTPETKPETPVQKETSQEVQQQPTKEEVQQEVERPKKGIPNAQFDDGLGKLEEHKFRKGEGISYEEQLEIEKELFGDTGVLSQAQFNELNYNALEAKEAQDNGETEDSGGVADLRVPEGTLQTGRDSGVSTDNRPVQRPEVRNELEGTETGNGESVSLLTDKKGKPIGRAIPEVNGQYSKTTQKLISDAYDGKPPTETTDWKQITKSKNKDDDDAVTIFNKLFKTNLKKEDITEVYVLADGKAGFAVDKKGFCTVCIGTGKPAVLANTLLIARNVKGVRYIYSGENTAVMSSVASKAGYEPVGILKVDGKENMVLRKTDKSNEEVSKEFKNNHDIIDVDSSPFFRSQQELEQYDEIISTSPDKKAMTRKETTQVYDRVQRAVNMFPSTSDEELQYLIDSVNEFQENKNSYSKMNSEQRYLLAVIKQSAQEELDRRGGKDIDQSEESMLTRMSGGEELAEQREKEQNKSTHTAEELLSEAMKPWTKKEDKAENAKKTEADEDQVQRSEKRPATEEFSDFYKMLRKGNKEESKVDDMLAQFGIVRKEDSNTQQEQRLSQFEKEENEQDEIVVEIVENTPAKDVKPVGIKDIKQHNDEDNHKVSVATLDVDGTRHKGIPAKQDVTIDQANQIIDDVQKNYPKEDIFTGVNNMSEEDKHKIGALYRKLQRQLAMVETRLYKGLFGARKQNYVISHALEHRRFLRRSLLAKVNRIMRENNIQDFYYGYDEIDTAKKLTPKQVQKLVDDVKRQENIIAKNKEALKNMPKGKDKTTLWKNTKVLEHEVADKKAQLWSHGYDQNGKQGTKTSFRDEHAQFRQKEEQRAEMQKKMETARQAKSDNVILEGSRRQRTVRKAQQRAAERNKNATPELDREVVVDNSMRGNERKWWDVFEKKGQQVFPILNTEELSKPEDLLKFKPVAELVKMAKGGEDVKGMLSTVNTLINNAVKYGQITKEKGTELKNRVKDITNAYNEQLNKKQGKPKTQPTTTNQIQNKKTVYKKETPQKSTMMDDDTFNKFKKKIFDTISKDAEWIQNTTTEKIVRGIMNASGQKLTDKQIKNIDNRLKMEKERAKEKSKQDNKSKKQSFKEYLNGKPDVEDTYSEVEDVDNQEIDVERKGNPQDNPYWNNYYDKKGLIVNKEEGVYHHRDNSEPNVEYDLDDPLFIESKKTLTKRPNDIYYIDDYNPFDGQDYVNTLTGIYYRTSDKILSNLKKRILDGLKSKKLKNIKYWKGAVKEINNELEYRNGHKFNIPPNDNNCPFTSEMIFDNMVEQAEVKPYKESNIVKETKGLIIKAVGKAKQLAKKTADKITKKEVRGIQDGIEQTLDFGKRNGEIKNRASRETRRRNSQEGLLRGNNAKEIRTEETDGKGNKRNSKQLGLSITRELVNEGAKTLVGKKVENVDDLVEVAQVLRHPGYEKLHHVYVKDGKVVYHETVTVGLPASVNPILVGQEARDVGWHIAYNARQYNADSLYVIHNHPSGNPQPSNGDIANSKAFRNMIRNGGLYVYGAMSYGGDIVLDTDKACFIEKDGTIREVPVSKKAQINYMQEGDGNHILLNKKVTDSKNGQASILSGELIKISKKIADESNLTAFFLSTDDKIRGIVQLPSEFADMKQDRMNRYLRWLARNNYSKNVFLTTSDNNIYEKIKGLYDQGHSVLDVVLTSKDRIASQTVTTMAKGGNYSFNNDNYFGIDANEEKSYMLLGNEKEKYQPQIKKKDTQQNNSNQNKSKQQKTRHQEGDNPQEDRDIYSFTFTKDSLDSNEDRINKLEKDDKFWKKKKNPDGSITYTRKRPEPHHTKDVTYSGVNGKTVKNKPFESVSGAAKYIWDKYTEMFFNSQQKIKDLADMVGASVEWMKFVVAKDMGSVAMSAIERGIIKHNSPNKERTVSLLDIIKAIPKQLQLDFLDYCEAYRVKYDLEPRGIHQKMSLEKAEEKIYNAEHSPHKDLFQTWRKKFVEYNHELLHVLVDGHIITEAEYQALIKQHPNFIPLSKDMSDFDDMLNFRGSGRDLINIKSPLHRIGTSMREVKNPFMEMQKRTIDYYQRAAKNRATLILIDDIIHKITQNAQGDEVMLHQALIHKLKPQYNKNGGIKDISDDNKGIFYVMRDGKKEFYQLSDASVYKALKDLSPSQMSQFGKFANFFMRKPAWLTRELATITFDFAIGNLVRDIGEAFITSRHGFVPFYDSLWGMWQLKNDTQWFKEYNAQVGDMVTRVRENDRVATEQQRIFDTFKNFPPVRWMLDFNELMEQGTRIGEYKNARMGYEGTRGRMKGGLHWATDEDLKKAQNSKEYAAYRSKEITLNFLQHGTWGGEINKYVPFTNAFFQGQNKIIDTLSEIKNNKEGFRNEMLLKGATIAFLAFMAGWNGADDDDYEEAPEWEKDSYYVLGNGLRVPKDQVFGKIIGNPFEKLGYMLKKGELDGEGMFKTLTSSLRELAAPEDLTPSYINLWMGLVGNYDRFRGRAITPEYMKDKISYLQKDLSTSNLAADISELAYDIAGIKIGAKKLDWTLQQFMSNTGKYVNKLWDIGRKQITGKENERTGHMYMDEDSKGVADFLNYKTDNDLIDGVLDLARMAFGKKFIQNQTTFEALQDFNEEYARLKELTTDPSKMTKEEERMYKNFYAPAFKKIKENQKKLSEIGRDDSLDRNQKLAKARPIILKNIEIARWANSKKK